MAAPTADDEGTWTDEEPGSDPPDRAEVISVRDHELRAEKQRHTASMQMRVLVGVGLVLATTLITIVIAVWVDAISESFAADLARMILPPAIGSGTTIVGALFISRSVSNEAT